MRAIAVASAGDSKSVTPRNHMHRFWSISKAKPLMSSCCYHFDDALALLRELGVPEVTKFKNRTAYTKKSASVSWRQKMIGGKSMSYSKEIYKEICLVFARLGLFAFGGPAAHIAMMEDELVTKRKWLTKADFMDLLGFTNLIPGPNSTELAIALGYKRGGKIGLFLAGICFILPAMTIVLLLAMFYKQYGEVPLIEAIFAGIKPVILAVIIQALFRLGQTTIQDVRSLLLFLAAWLLSLFGIGEITVLLLAGLAMLLMQQLSKWRTRHLAVEPMSLTLVFLTFLKIGSVLYGSGYVLLAFLQAEFIERYAALTSTQLLDAVAIGQFTPGPVFTTATFVGYLIQGVPGALLATVGIFLPSFLLILLLHPLFNKLRASKIFAGILDGITVASLALMASVSWQLGLATFVSWVSVILFGISLIALTRFKLNSSYLIIMGGCIGWLLTV